MVWWVFPALLRYIWHITSCKFKVLWIVYLILLYSGSAGKESAWNAEDQASIPGLGRSPGEGKGYPLQYSGLENSMDYVVHGIAKSQTWLSNFHCTSLQQYKTVKNWCVHNLNNYTEPKARPKKGHIQLSYICKILENRNESIITESISLIVWSGRWGIT